MKVFLTGSTGFVGLNILSSLQDAGHEVHLYVRAGSKRDYIERFDAHLHEGELDDLATMTQAMQGMDAVIHTAGNTSCLERDYDILYQVNVVGTKNIVDAALANGVKRLVYTSTTSTIGGSDSQLTPVAEDAELTGFRADSPYGRTKVLAEQEVMRAHQNGIHSIILNPAEIIGAFDHNFQWGRLIMAVDANQVPFVPRGSGSFCSAKAVGDAHVAALTLGCSGERYILAGDDQKYSTFLALISTLLGKTFDEPTLDHDRLYNELVQKELDGEDALIEAYRFRVFSGDYFYDCQKACQALNFEVVKLEDMLREAIAWYRDNGFLQA